MISGTIPSSRQRHQLLIRLLGCYVRLKPDSPSLLRSVRELFGQRLVFLRSLGLYSPSFIDRILVVDVSRSDLKGSLTVQKLQCQRLTFIGHSLKSSPRTRRLRNESPLQLRTVESDHSTVESDHSTDQGLILGYRGRLP